MKTIALSMLTILLYSLCFSQDTVPYSSNNGKYITVNGTQLYYEEYGQGTPLIAIHGGLSSIKDIAPLIPELSKKFRVIAVDCPGQGRSEQADSLGYQLLADYFSKMIDQMKLDSVYVFGYSDGGNAALLLAADRPDKVKKTAAFAAASHTSGYYPEAIAGLDQLTPEEIEKNFKWWLEPHLQKTPQKGQWKKFVKDFSSMCATPLIVPEEKLRKIQSSVLIVQGDNDIVKPEHALKLHQAIENSQLCIIPAASHFILYERPELFNVIVREFFTKEPKLFDWTELGN
ncbi:alpha/beta hydrolase [Chitinophaga sp. MM2321]|uniref:alpha/beta fold hydrolase n=1 Tax=Chitinophaga sp. MM2321 TaxID=3137178 RepID=UPI0032D577DB